MLQSISKQRIRINFKNYKQEYNQINLIKIQSNSYENFMQFKTSKKTRNKKGLEEVLCRGFSIIDFEGKISIDYKSYILENCILTPNECMNNEKNYSCTLKVNLRLIIWYINENSGLKEIYNIKDQQIILTEIPLMTKNGTFIINGTQRVVVSQIHRSPGIIYSYEETRNCSSKERNYSARIIPIQGSWLDFEFDSKNILYFRIDRKKKLFISTLLRALGYKTQKILKKFYKFFNVKIDKGIIKLLDEQNEKKIKLLNSNYIKNYFFAKNIINPVTSRKLYNASEEIKESTLEILEAFKILNIVVICPNNINSFSSIRDSIFLDKNLNEKESLNEIYKLLRPGESFVFNLAKRFLQRIFFDSSKYNLSIAGRIKINKKNGLNIYNEVTFLTSVDIFCILKNLLKLQFNCGDEDDIDSLINRRVKTVGELVKNQFLLTLNKIQKLVFDRISIIDINFGIIKDLINSKITTNGLKDFFGLSQLSQFMDQTNPLSEITHKRRLSALGPGGLTRERAGFEVRDVHHSHYNRICPIESPEGQNIGLISSLSTYADIDEYGFIETPYRIVKKGFVTNKVIKLNAIEEDKYYISKSNIIVNSYGEIKKDVIPCHKNGEILDIEKTKLNLMNICSQQLISVASSLIPFLENNDANRALMGANMQRQAVPLMINESPWVGTGMESIVIMNSGASLIAKRSGIVFKLDAKKIIVKVFCSEIFNEYDILGIDTYVLTKYHRSNQGTCITQKPVVYLGQYVKKGEIIADGFASNLGELSLGKNILVAFMTWNGYNFEDSILLSERLIKHDVYTSIHINEYESLIRDTRIGMEEITKEIPNTNEEFLRHLDQTGIAKIGSEVKGGEILVGKISPKIESPLTPEEKLLKSIFGEQAANIKNSSLKMPPGDSGIVVDVKVLIRCGIDKDSRTVAIENYKISNLWKNRIRETKIILKHILIRINDIFDNEDLKFKVYKNKNAKQILYNKVNEKRVWKIVFSNKVLNKKLILLKKLYSIYKKKIVYKYNEEINKLKNGYNLPQGIVKIIKIYIIKKLKIQSGDKMAGRHGNKGVVSRVIPIEEMPFLNDGTVIDILLNPLGVPSRMNIGQIFETHLGLISKKYSINFSTSLKKYINKQTSSFEKEEFKEHIKKNIYIPHIKKEMLENHVNKLNKYDLLNLCDDILKGVKFSTPVFNGIKEKYMNDILNNLNIDMTGQVYLRDGRTGEYFDRKITIGYIYMLKLDHLIENKIHSRSIGPYSLITQQPLGGKSCFGGQRFGEMECWALQAYGAAYTLQEIITIKSDDVVGRVKAYESIIRGVSSFEVTLPESFKVMIKEIRALGLNIQIVED